MQHSPFPPFTVQLDEYSSAGIPVLTGWKAVQPSPHIRPFSEVATPLIKYNGIPALWALLKHRSDRIHHIELWCSECGYMCFNLVPCFGMEYEARPLTFVNGLTAAVIKHEVVLNPHLHILQHIKVNQCSNENSLNKRTFDNFHERPPSGLKA